MDDNPAFGDIYRDRTVLVTGHTGFKGSWLSIWLHELGAHVVGYALDPGTDKDNFVLSGLGKKMVDIRGDVRDRDHLGKVFESYRPEVVFHLAAQPLVRASYADPVTTYETNVMGTVNVLEAIRSSDYAKTGSGSLRDTSSPDALHETTLLALDISKARFRLGWTPALNLDETIELTVQWYKKYAHSNVYRLCSDQIKSFAEKCRYIAD